MACGVTCFSSDPNVLMPTTTETAAISPTRANVPLDGILPLPFGPVDVARFAERRAEPASKYTIAPRHQNGRAAALQYDRSAKPVRKLQWRHAFL